MSLDAYVAVLRAKPMRLAVYTIRTQLNRPPSILALLSLLAVGMPAFGQAKIVGRVEHVGFPGGGTHFFRPGMWCSAVVPLRNEGSVPLAGHLTIRQRDRDGDMTLSETVVTVMADGRDRQYRLDFVPDLPGPSGAFVIYLSDEQNRPVPIHEGASRRDALLTPPVTPLTQESVVVLDLSARPITGLDNLADRSRDKLRQPLLVSRLPPSLLPDRGHLLQAVRAIIWDNPDPTRLQPQQTQALVDYARGGGVLVLAAGRSAPALAKSSLGKVLPAKVSGTVPAQVLQETWSRLLRTTSEPVAPMYIPPITLAAARAAPYAVVVSSQDDLRTHVVTRGCWGSGTVVFVAAELKDLFQQGGDTSRFLSEVLGLLEEPDPKSKGAPIGQGYDLTQQLQGFIGFQSLGGAFLSLVVLFVAGYVLLATGGVWLWLRRRNALQQSWFLFAVIAVGCSILSVVFVQMVRGVGINLRQATIVDVWVPADGTPARQGQATVWFGLKTGTHTRLDLCLDSVQAENAKDPSRWYLIPLPPEPERLERGFVAPEVYSIRPAQAMIENTPIRATLKRFHGHWAGDLGGGLSASIRVDSSGSLLPGGWVRNDLGVDLHDCWLLSAETWRMGGAPRDTRIYVHQLSGVLKTGGGRFPIEVVRSVDPARWPTLQEMHRQWSAPFTFLGIQRSAQRAVQPQFRMDHLRTSLMLLTTLDEYLPNVDGRQISRVFERAGVQHLDRSRLLTQGTVMLIGFADTPGPVRLKMRTAGQEQSAWRPLEPEDSRTMFRFVLSTPAQSDV